LIAEPVIDLTSGSAPAYWSAECGGRTYVGSYTLMMDWAQCRDYCTYFPHAAELGHNFDFADILDTDTMECLRYNMNQQYTPSNGYDGHYWAAGYRGGDGHYRWDSGEPFEFNDFITDPGQDPFIHLTPGNNYQWNTKSDQNDKNNGCLCKSQDLNKDVKLKDPFCPPYWFSIGSKCVRFARANFKTWYDAHKYCLHYEAELLSWRSEAEFMMTSFYWAEIEAVTGTRYKTWGGAICNMEWGDWVWGNVTNDLIPMSFGWLPGNPEEWASGQCGGVCAFNADSSGLGNDGCDKELEFTCEKDVQ